MSDLLNALKRFKANRQTGQSEDRPLVPSEVSEAGEISEVSEDSEISQLVLLYQAVCDRGALSDETTKRMQDDFTTRWDRLAEEERKILVDELLRRRLLPEIVGKALVLFKGKMTRLM